MNIFIFHLFCGVENKHITLISIKIKSMHVFSSPEVRRESSQAVREPGTA